VNFVLHTGIRWPARLREVFSSLKLQVTLVTIAALVLAIGATTAALIQRAERDTLSVQSARELDESARIADLLSRRIVVLQRSLQVVAVQLDRTTLADPRKLGAFIESKPVLRELFSSLSVAGTDGEVRIFADAGGLRHPHMNVADRDYFQRTLNEQRPVVSEALPSRITGNAVTVFTYPLKDAHGVYGVLAGALRLASRDLLSDLAEVRGNDADVLMIVTDSHGRIIAHPNRDRLLQPVSTEPRLSEAFRHWQEIGAPAEPSGLRLARQTEMVSAAGVAGPDWMVWRAIPESSLLAPLRAARQSALGWAAALILLASGLMLAMLSWLLRPLTRLEHRALHLFNDAADLHRDWPEGSGEIGRLARVLRHVSAERAQLEGFNAAVLGKLSSVMAAAPAGIVFTRLQRFELVSAEFCRLIGREEHELLGQPEQMIFASNTDHRSFVAQVTAAFEAGDAYAGEWEMRRADGSLFWAALRGRPVAAGDASAGTIWTLNDIDEQVIARAQLEWSATHDELTRLANRRGFERHLERVLEALPGSVPAALVMIDLDHFKPINDAAGHAAGDAMLKAVAVAIASQVREDDVVARLGGDEFALLLQRCPNEVAMRIAENVRAAVAAIGLRWEGRLLRVGASVGVAMLHEHTASMGDWLAEADAACYKAKADGRGTVRSAGTSHLKVVGGRAARE
jgi:diguanylate cyclase (GGDEF)-like protein/PAS domain S-box-containing protein